MNAFFENQIFMKPMQAQRRQLAPQQRTMGPLSLVRSAEEHGGPHEGWFWDPTRQGGGVLSDMGCHSIAAGWYALTPIDKPVDLPSAGFGDGRLRPAQMGPAAVA